MKKPVTWIYKASEQLRSKLKWGTRSKGRVPMQIIPAEASLSEGEPSRWQQVLAKLPRPLRLFVKPFLIIACLVGLYAVLGFYALPSVLKAKLPGIIQEQTGRTASVAKIEFNPFKLFARIQGFKIAEKDSKDFAGFDDFSVKINGLNSIKQFAVVIDDIVLNKPSVHLVKLKDSKFNFEDMIKSKKKEPEKPGDGKLFPVHIAKLSITDGKLLWDDKHFAKPVSEEIAPINLTVSDLSTKENAKAKLDFNFALKSAGKFDWQANLGINPLFSDGTIKLDKVQLQKIIALALSDTAPFELQGNEAFKVDYNVGMDKKDISVTVKNSKIELRDFQFADKSEAKNVFKTPLFTLETDALVKIVKNNLEVTVKKLKLGGSDMAFSNQLSQPMSIKIPSLTHENDLKVTLAKDGLKVVTDKVKVSLKDLQFNGFDQNKAEAKIPELTLEAGFQLAQNEKMFDVNVVQGKLELHNLQVNEKGEPKTLIKIPAFSLNGISVNLKNQEVVLDSVTGKDAEFQAWLNKDGTVNYQHLMSASTSEKKQKKPDINTAKTVDFTEDAAKPMTAPTDQKAKPQKDWLIKIKNVSLENFGLTFEDKTLKKPVVMTAKPINVKLNNFDSKLDSKLPFQLEIGVNKTGSIKLKGDTVISPLLAKTDVDVKNIDLETFQPYVDKFARLDVLDGKFNIGGKLAVQQQPKKPLDVKFKGNTNIANLLTRDQLQNKDFIKWKNLTFKELDVDLSANRYTSSELVIEKPFAKVTIRKDKTMNFSDIMVAEKTPTQKSVKSPKNIPKTKVSSKTSPSDRPFFKLNKVSIIDGSSDFADLSLILPFAAQIKSLDGGASGISSEQKSTIKVDLKGNAYDLAPVDINGEVSPYLGNFNIYLKFDGMPMPLVTPYMVEFAGYKIEKGKLTLGLQYKVENGNLQAANNILIDQLELGEKVENPRAVSLPLQLAITLLKDSDGKIKLDVPLTGSLEDPKFSISSIIVDALVNVLTKVITSPFNAIASLVGSDEDLSTVMFTPGKYALEPSETGKLDSVAKALKEKPALNLEIKGAAFEKEDWAILKREALLDQLKSTKAAEVSREKGKQVLPEYVELSEDEYNDLLADAFIRRFPTMAEKSLLRQPKLIPPLTGDFYQVAKEKMSELIKPDPKRLKDLASERSKEIAKYIVQKGGIPNERVYILDSVLDPEREGKEIAATLSLRTN